MQKVVFTLIDDERFCHVFKRFSKFLNVFDVFKLFLQRLFLHLCAELAFHFLDLPNRLLLTMFCHIIILTAKPHVQLRASLDIRPFAASLLVYHRSPVSVISADTVNGATFGLVFGGSWAGMFA